MSERYRLRARIKRDDAHSDDVKTVDWPSLDKEEATVLFRALDASPDFVDVRVVRTSEEEVRFL